MTNKEALVRGVLSQFTIDDIEAEKSLLDNVLVGAEDYTPSNEERIDLCAYQLLQNQYISSMSEGGYSVSYDRSAIERKLSYLSKKYGWPNVIGGPVIKDASFNW